MSLSFKRQAFVEAYLKCWNASQAAREAGYRGRSNTIGERLLSNVDIRARINERTEQIAASTNEILIGLTEQAHGDLGVFFKINEEWTFFPRPTDEILGEEEVDIPDDEGKPTGKKRVSYWVKRICIDMDKVIDPRYSRLIHKFSDSPKDGLGIEIYNKQTAWQILAKIRGMMVDRTELTGKDGGPIPVQMIEVVVLPEPEDSGSGD